MKRVKYLSIIASLLAFSSCEQGSRETTGSLKDCYKDSFLIGTCVDNHLVNGRSPEDEEILHRHFNAITAENDMKPESIHPKPDVWNFKRSDEFVQFGLDHNMWKLGHALVWHNQTPSFFWFHEDGTPKTKPELIETMRSYIETVAGRYAGKIDAWDVVIEIIGEQGEYRNLGWVKAFDGDGYEVVKNAFTFASQYAPEAELYYSDFNVWRRSHLDGIVSMVKRLQKDGVRIDGVGIQGHWGLNYPEAQDIEHAIDTLASLGLKVSIGELDIDVLPLTKEGQVIGKCLQEAQFQLEEFKTYLDPYRDGLPEDVAKELDARFEELFRIFYKHRNQIERVSFWGLTDDKSWKNGYPIPNRTNYPLLFNRDHSAKPALNALLGIPE